PPASAGGPLCPNRGRPGLPRRSCACAGSTARTIPLLVRLYSKLSANGEATGAGRAGLVVAVRADDEWQGQALLVLVLALLVRVAGAADRLGAEEQDLGDALVGVDLRRQRRRVADLDRDLAPPLRLQR